MKKVKNAKRRPHRLISAFLIIVVLLGALPLTALPAGAASGSGGNKWDPYVVNTYDELWNALDHRGNATGKKYIMLGCDIDTSEENAGFGLPYEKRIYMLSADDMTLDLNGKTLTISSQAADFSDAMTVSCNLTICDTGGFGGGKILYKHSIEGGRSLIRMFAGYKLTVNDGVTLEVDAQAHDAIYNATLYLTGNANAVINDAKLLYDRRDHESLEPTNWATGVYVEAFARLTINGGEFTRVVVNKPLREGGDQNPDVVINGGVFRRPLAINAGNTLDKKGPMTLPVRVNGGEFHRIEEPREWYKNSGERQFYLYIEPYGNDGQFLNFESTPAGDNDAQWMAEVNGCMQQIYRNLFPADTVLQWEDTEDLYANGNGLQKLSDLAFTSGYKDYRVWSFLCIVEAYQGKKEYIHPDKLTVYSNVFGVKAEYGGEDALTGTASEPFITDLGKDNQLKITWNETLPAGLAESFRIVMYYAVDGAIHELAGTSNGDGTYSATITLPDIASGREYQIGLAPIMALKRVADPSAYPSAADVKTLWLKSLTTIVLGESGGVGFPFRLGGPLKAGDTAGPDVLVGGVTGVDITEQGPWRFYSDADEQYMPVSSELPFPISTDCYKVLTLKAEPGYLFSTRKNALSVMLQKPEGGLLGTFYLSVSPDGKTATVEVRAATSAVYEELNLTIPALKAGNEVPFDVKAIWGLPSGITMEGTIEWSEKGSDEGSIKRTVLKGEKFRQGYTYECELWLCAANGVTVPEDVKATINGKPATYEAAYDGYFFLYSAKFTLPDSRTAIEDAQFFLDDEMPSYTANTDLLQPISAAGRFLQTSASWYDAEGNKMTGALAPKTTYTFKATYVPMSGYRFEPTGFTVKLFGGDNLPASQVSVTTEQLIVTYSFTTPENMMVDVTVNAVGFDPSAYEVSGNTVTVTYDRACKLGYLDGEEYKSVAATKIEDGKYSFIVPDGVKEVILVVKGDVNGDGNVSVADKTALAKHLLPETHKFYKKLTAFEIFALDLNGDGQISTADKAALAKSLLPESHKFYTALDW